MNQGRLRSGDALCSPVSDARFPVIASGTAVGMPSLAGVALAPGEPHHAAERKGTSMAAPQPPSADLPGGPDLSDLPAEAWRLMRQFVEVNANTVVLRERLGLGTGSGRIRVLFLLREQAMTLAQLAEAHGVDRPYATIIVDKLEQLGYVERRPHPSDRRSKVVTLTPAGQDAAALATSTLSEPPAALRSLDAGQVAELIGLMSLLA
jgi:DNA-binding MarR family transcriptional regulator